MLADGHALQAARPPALDNVDLAAGSIDPHAEAGQVVIPEDGLLALGGEPVHDALTYPQIIPWRYIVLQNLLFYFNKIIEYQKIS